MVLEGRGIEEGGEGGRSEGVKANKGGIALRYERVVFYKDERVPALGGFLVLYLDSLKLICEGAFEGGVLVHERGDISELVVCEIFALFCLSAL